MIVAVTGGTGFIGSHLVEALSARGDIIRLLSRGVTKSSVPKVTNFSVDYNQPETFQAALTGCNTIFHLAAALRAPRQSDIIEQNRNSAKTLISATRQFAPSAKIIVCSSQAAAGPSLSGNVLSDSDTAQPISIYGKSKRAAEEEFEKCGDLNWTILRPPAVFGPRERDIFMFFKALAKGWSSQIGTIQRQFSWIYVKDFVEALLIAGSSENLTRQIHLVKSGDTNWNEFRSTSSLVLGTKFHLLTLPRWLLNMVATSGEAWSRVSGKPVLLNRDKISELSYPDWRCDDSIFRKLFGYQPRYDLTKAVTETIEWYRAEKWL